MKPISDHPLTSPKSSVMRHRWAAALLGMALGAPAFAFGPTYTTYHNVSLCHPWGFVDSPALSLLCGSNYGVASGVFEGGHATASLDVGLNRFSNAQHTNFQSSLDARYNWNDQLTIVSATLPVGTPVLLNIGTQVSLRYDLVRDPVGGDDGVFAQAHFKVASPTYFGNDVARTRFRSTTGWAYADETSGSSTELGSSGTTGIARGGVLVYVGDLVTIDLIFRATTGLQGAGWAQTDIPYSATLHDVDAYFSISVEPYPNAMSALASGSFGTQAVPLVDYVAASGTRFPAALPVPEPSTYAMFVAGLLILRLAARRRT